MIMATVTLDKMAYKNKVLYGVTFTLVALGILISIGGSNFINGIKGHI